jgi:hypothetical protein
MSRTPHTGWLKRSRIVGSMLAGYWIALAVATHIPVDWMKWGEVDAKRMMADGGDKVLHLLAYFGLAILLCGWMAARGRFTAKTATGIAILCFIYAIVDELLQIPVGRSADVMDVLADWAGAALGIAVFVLFDRTVALFRRSPRSAEDEP